MNILIVKSAALGDVLRTTSLLGPLKHRYPDSKIVWVTAPEAKPLLDGNPRIDKILTLPRAARMLSKEFDLVLSMEEDPKAARLAQSVCHGELIGIFPKKAAGKNNLGYAPSSALYYDMSLLNRDPDGGLKTANRLKSDNRLSYAELWLTILGLSIPEDRSLLRPSLHLKPGDRTAAKTLARRHGLTGQSRPIGLNPGAGKRWPAKQLSEGAAAELIMALHNRFKQPVLLFGGKEEAARNRRILKQAKGAGIDAGTGHGLRSFAGLLDLCDTVVTTDSLAFHIATALGKNVFPLIGPTSAAELDTFERGETILPPDGCSCFYQAQCTARDHCLDLIPAQTILHAIDQCQRL